MAANSKTTGDKGPSVKSLGSKIASGFKAVKDKITGQNKFQSHDHKAAVAIANQQHDLYHNDLKVDNHTAQDPEKRVDAHEGKIINGDKILEKTSDLSEETADTKSTPVYAKDTVYNPSQPSVSIVPPVVEKESSSSPTKASASTTSFNAALNPFNVGLVGGSSDLTGNIISNTTQEVKVSNDIIDLRGKGDSGITSNGGHDTYVVDETSGHITIAGFSGIGADSKTVDTEYDTLQFGKGMSAENMIVDYDADGNTVITFSGIDNFSLTLKDFDYRNLHNLPTGNNIVFEDGSSFNSISFFDNDADTITGSDGNDIIAAMGGDDFISAGTGNDIISGGGGADTFAAIGATDGSDTILDFKPDEGDSIQITLAGTDKVIDLSKVTVEYKNGNTEITFPRSVTGGEEYKVTLKNFNYQDHGGIDQLLQHVDFVGSNGNEILIKGSENNDVVTFGEGGNTFETVASNGKTDVIYNFNPTDDSLSIKYNLSYPNESYKTINLDSANISHDADNNTIITFSSLDNSENYVIKLIGYNYGSSDEDKKELLSKITFSGGDGADTFHLDLSNSNHSRDHIIDNFTSNDKIEIAYAPGLSYNFHDSNINVEVSQDNPKDYIISFLDSEGRTINITLKNGVDHFSNTQDILDKIILVGQRTTVHDLTKGSETAVDSGFFNDTFIIGNNSGNITINNFGGTFDSLGHYTDFDTLRFTGDGMSAETMIIEQDGDDTVISFEGLDTKIRLANFNYENLDNIPLGLNNIIFGPDDKNYGFTIFHDNPYDTYDTIPSGSESSFNSSRVGFFSNDGTTIQGSSNRDVINAMGGDDKVHAGAGDDIVRGGSGNDTIWGDAGNDRLTGGSGADIFAAIGASDGNDIITDFKIDEGDLIQVTLGGTYDASVGKNVVSLTDITIESADGGKSTIIKFPSSATGGEPYSVKLEGFAYNEDNRQAILQRLNIVGKDGSDILINGDDDGNIIYAGNSGSAITGGGGDDIIYGGAGVNLIQGDEGNDTLTGGSGKNTFLAKAVGDGHDTITNFDISKDNINVTFDTKTINASDVKVSYVPSDQDPQGHGYTLITFGSGENSYSVKLDGFNYTNGHTLDELLSRVTIIGDDGQDHIFIGDDNDNLMRAGDGSDSFEIDAKNGGSDYIKNFDVNHDVINVTINKEISSETGKVTIDLKGINITSSADNNSTIVTFTSDVTGGRPYSITLLGLKYDGNREAILSRLNIINGTDDSTETVIIGNDDDNIIAGGVGKDIFVSHASSDNGTDTIVGFNDPQDRIQVILNGQLDPASGKYVIDLHSVIPSYDGHNTILTFPASVTGGTSAYTIILQGFDYRIDGINNLFSRLDFIGKDGGVTVIGGDDNDYIQGGSGDNIISGGLGDDILTGGSGSNTFTAIAATDGHDTITNFDLDHDLIKVALNGNIDDQGRHIIDLTSVTIEPSEDGHSTIITFPESVAGVEGTSYSVILEGLEFNESNRQAILQRLNIVGINGDSIIIGNDNGNIIYLGSGDNVVQSGLGNDTIFNNSGQDTFLTNVTTGAQDTIKNFDISKDNINVTFDTKTINASDVKVSYVPSDQDPKGHGYSLITFGSGENSYSVKLDGFNYTDGHTLNELLSRVTIIGDDGQGHTFIGDNNNNLMRGGDGSDTFQFTVGNNGNDIIKNFSVDNDNIKILYDKNIDFKTSDITIEKASADSRDIVIKYSNHDFTYSTITLKNILSNGSDILTDDLKNQIMGKITLGNIGVNINFVDLSGSVNSGAGSEDARDFFLIGSKSVTIDNFTGVGIGASDAIHDTIRFTDPRMSVDKMLLDYDSATNTTTITFQGIDDFSVTLNNFNYTDLDNLPNGLNNILFGPDDKNYGYYFNASRLTSSDDTYDTVNSGDTYTPDHVAFLSSGNDTNTGSTGDDIINAMGGNDIVHGSTGNDIIRGGDGNDILYGDEGQDVLIGGSGDDELRGGSGDDVLSGGKGNDILYGDAGDDSLIGGSGDDVLIGGSGSDILKGEDGSDSFVVGNDGSDHDSIIDFNYNKDNPNDANNDNISVSLNFIPSSVSVTTSDDHGTRITFSDSTQTYYLDLSNLNIKNYSTLTDPNATDEEKAASGLKYLLDNKIINYYSTYGNGNIIQGADNHTNYLAGGAYSDILIDGAKNDILDGGNSGRDFFVLSGTNGNVDTISGESFYPSYSGTDNIDSVFVKFDFNPDPTKTTQSYNGLDSKITFSDGTNSYSVILKNFNINSYYGNGLNGIDALKSYGLFGYSTPGGDVINAPNGYYTYIDGGDGDDKIYGGIGKDILLGGSGNDELHGGSGDDSLNGGSGNDKVYGDGGNDLLRGGSGDDILYDGTGNDTLLGGDGADTFNLTANSGDHDTINDFSSSDNDGISISFASGIDKNTMDATYDEASGTATISFNDGSYKIDLDNFADQYESLGFKSDAELKTFLQGFIHETTDAAGSAKNFNFTTNSDTFSHSDITNFDATNDSIAISHDRSTAFDTRQIAIEQGNGTDILVKIYDDINHTNVTKTITLKDEGTLDDTLKASIIKSISVIDSDTKIFDLTHQSDQTIDASGGNRNFVINANSGTVTINGFQGVGTGDHDLTHDTLRLTDPNMTAQNMNIDYTDTNGDGIKDTVITFDGVSNVKIILTNFDYNNLDNLPNGLNNILFANQINPNEIQNYGYTYDGGATSSIYDNYDTLGNATGASSNVSFFDESNNTINGTSGSDVINAMGGNDIVYGGSGNDIIRGGSGNDTVIAGSGNDTLEGDSGKDFLVVSSDSSTTDNHDTIVNFTSGNTADSDSILVKLDFTPTSRAATLDPDGNSVITFSDTSGHTYSLTLQNVDIGGNSGLQALIDSKQIQIATPGSDNLYSVDGYNNYLTGGDGADTFYLNGSNGGNDIVNFSGDDNLHVKLGAANINLSDSNNVAVNHSTDGHDTVITFHNALTGNGDYTITLKNYDYGSSDADKQALLSKVTFETTAGSHQITGNSSDNIIDFGTGVDSDTFITNSVAGGVDTIINFGKGSDIIKVNSSSTDINLNNVTTNYVDGNTIVTFPSTVTGGEPYTIKLAGYNYRTSGTEATDKANLLNAIKITSDHDSNFTGTSSNDTIDYSASAKNNVISGGIGSDTIIGGSGHDVLIAGTGANTLTGGAGKDVFYIDNLNRGASNTDTITDFELGKDILTIQSNGTSNFRDFSTSTGSTRSSIVIQGNDVILKLNYSGPDSISPHKEIVLKDIKLHNPGVSDANLIDQIRSSIVSVSGASSDSQVVYGIDNFDNYIRGTDIFGETITGYSGNDTIYGGGGNDDIRSGAGNDYIDGGTGNDTMTGGAGSDTFNIVANSGEIDKITDFDPAQDTIKIQVNLADIDISKIDISRDTTPGNTGTLIKIPTGFDISGNPTYHTINLTGYSYSDHSDTDRQNLLSKIVIETDDNVHNIYGSSRGDLIYSGGGNDTINSGGGDDDIYAGNGDDTIHGGDGNDTIQGGTGADKIYGDAGADTLYGGAGNDVFVYTNLTDSTSASMDIIMDFVQGQDHIDLSSLGIHSMDELNLTHDSDGNTIIHGTGDKANVAIEVHTDASNGIGIDANASNVADNFIFDQAPGAGGAA